MLTRIVILAPILIILSPFLYIFMIFDVNRLRRMAGEIEPIEPELGIIGSILGAIILPMVVILGLFLILFDRIEGDEKDVETVF